MDYENKYKELLARLQKAKENEEVNDERYCCVIDDIVPELKEDEDELTWLKNYISEEAYYLSMDIRDNKDSIKLQKLQKSLAWLKKQAADKPYYTELLGYFEIGKRLNHSVEEIIDWLKSKI